MNYKDLQKLGLNEKEAKIYLASLELGETTIQRIAKKSGVNRTSAYHIIPSLKEKGLMRSLTKRKKSFYYAEDPREMSAQLEERKNTLEKILPEMLSIANVIDKKPKIKYYEGIEGIKEIYKDILKYPNKEELAWIAGLPVSNPNNPFYGFFYNYFIPGRIKNKIWTRMITSDREGMEKYKTREEKEFRKTKLINHNKFPIDASINLYGDNKISIISFDEQVGLIIESEKIYTTLKSIFEMHWEAIEYGHRAP